MRSPLIPLASNDLLGCATANEAFGTEPGAVATGSNHLLHGSISARFENLLSIGAYDLRVVPKVHCLTRSLPLPVLYHEQHNG
jgi:hypothetical protein